MDTIDFIITIPILWTTFDSFVCRIADMYNMYNYLRSRLKVGILLLPMHFSKSYVTSSIHGSIATNVHIDVRRICLRHHLLIGQSAC